MNIVLAASECVPFAKVGGLGDVLGALAGCLARRGHDVRVFIPLYRPVRTHISGARAAAPAFSVPMGAGSETVELIEGAPISGVRFYFINNQRYFDRDGIYGNEGGEFSDNRERYILFNRAVLEALRATGFTPHIVHCHDWQAGLIPAYLKTNFAADPVLRAAASVMTIHNIAYQGDFPADTLDLAGLPPGEFQWDKLAFYGRFNMLKAGLVYADALTTVSPTYAREIGFAPYGERLEGLISARSADMTGILNGLDYSVWDPATDRVLGAPYSVRNMEGKHVCRRDLIRISGLQGPEHAPILGMVSRLDAYKGFDLVVRSAHRFIAQGARFVVLGSGDVRIASALNDLARSFPGSFSFRTGFDEKYARMVYAGSDLFLMPSLVEPCGIAQMIALRYGTVPVVAFTGGLVDTVCAYRPSSGRGTGFIFRAGDLGAFEYALASALRIFADQDRWKALMRACMKVRFLWDESALGYEKVYQQAIHRHMATIKKDMF